MTRMLFYMLGRKNDVLPTAGELLEAAFVYGLKSYVVAQSLQQANDISAHLHARRQSYLLPHQVMPFDVKPKPAPPRASEPIVIGDFFGGAGADLLLFFDGTELPPHAASFGTVCYLFSGADEASLDQARLHWYRALWQNFEVRMFGRDERGLDDATAQKFVDVNGEDKRDWERIA